MSYVALARAAHWILAYAWNPLLATEVAGSGHIDILGALLLLVSFAALLRRWRAIAAVAFALAVAVKFLPIVLLPLYWRRVRIRDALLAAMVFAVLYLPFLNHGRIPFGSLGTYIPELSFQRSGICSARASGGSAGRSGTRSFRRHCCRNLVQNQIPDMSADAFAWPMAASLLCAPVVYPWYLLWLLPFVRS